MGKCFVFRFLPPFILTGVYPIRTGWNDSRTSSPAPRFDSRGPYNERGRGAFAATSTRPSSGWESPNVQRETFGFGCWKDGRHVVGGRNVRIEKELFGEASDPSAQHTGINFEKYDDIPVEATGAGVPDPIITFTSPPLDPVLLENIGYARYSTPTPVQKYSIPIVAAARDLMACAQVSFSFSLVAKRF
jgi:ATP-dependent RNA helicase DDX3X